MNAVDRPCKKVEIGNSSIWGNEYFSLCEFGEPEEMVDPETGARFERVKCKNCGVWLNDLPLSVVA